MIESIIRWRTMTAAEMEPAVVQDAASDIESLVVSEKDKV
jgi:hypothetical protein